MYLSEVGTKAGRRTERRQSGRLNLQCRARIRIGSRQYAGYLHNISRTGAKLRTITPIHRIGNVVLRLPDLRPLRCRLCWTDSYNAGVSFELPLSRAELSEWARTRSGILELRSEREVAELTSEAA